MVKLAVGPEQSVVAGGAEADREPSSDVVWDVAAVGWRVVPIFQVALRVAAIRRGESGGVIVADMAVRTLINLTCGSQLVRAGKREARRAVIKGRGQERNGVVAVRAVCGGKWRAC